MRRVIADTNASGGGSGGVTPRTLATEFRTLGALRTALLEAEVVVDTLAGLWGPDDRFMGWFKKRTSAKIRLFGELDFTQGDGTEITLGDEASGADIQLRNGATAAWGTPGEAGAGLRIVADGDLVAVIFPGLGTYDGAEKKPLACQVIPDFVTAVQYQRVGIGTCSDGRSEGCYAGVRTLGTGPFQGNHAYGFGDPTSSATGGGNGTLHYRAFETGTPITLSCDQLPAGAGDFAGLLMGACAGDALPSQQQSVFAGRDDAGVTNDDHEIALVIDGRPGGELAILLEKIFTGAAACAMGA